MRITPRKNVSHSTNNPKNFLHEKIDSNRTRSKIKNVFLEWSLCYTSHCYPKIFQYENILAKAIWIVFFVFFNCLTFWFLVIGLIDYFDFEVISKIRVYSEQTLVYPTITICNANPFTTKYAENMFHDASNSFYTFQNDTILNYLNFDSNNSTQNKIDTSIFKVSSLINYGMNRSLYMDDLEKKRLGLSLNDILHTCFFNGIKCDTSDFYWFYNYFYGNCFQFNSGRNKSIPLKETKLSGYLTGLLLFVRNFTNLNKYPTFFSSGLRVFVHNNSYFSSSIQDIYVEVGKHTSISIKKTLTYRTPMPYSECREMNDFKSKSYDIIKKSNIFYSQYDCIQICLQNIVIEKCKCFISTFSQIELNATFNPCFSENEMLCYMKEYLDYLNNTDKRCDNNECPLECEHASYDLTSSSLDYPTKQFFDDLKNGSKDYENMSLDEFKQTHLALFIYYASKEYTEIREIPKIKFVDLISNLGGSLGIFLGFSIFSFIEIFELLFHIIFIIFYKK